ncbi:MAG: hypothetical protein LC797_15425 [Chloroflexi bacterium]|nr:hypothetical protein [Chloroflexota bacterium]
MGELTANIGALLRTDPSAGTSLHVHTQSIPLLFRASTGDFQEEPLV